MTDQQLTPEQERFLKECSLEFSERFTNLDLEFKAIYDAEIPPPPIMFPWYGRPRYNNRDYQGGSRNDHYRNRNSYQHNPYGNREQRYNYNRR